MKKKYFVQRESVIGRKCNRRQLVWQQALISHENCKKKTATIFRGNFIVHTILLPSQRDWSAYRQSTPGGVSNGTQHIESSTF